MSTRRWMIEIFRALQSCVPGRSRPSRTKRSRQETGSPRAGPSSAIGSSRSLTVILSPREACRRYRLKWALSSVTLMDCMTTF